MSQLLNNNSYFNAYCAEIDAQVMKVQGTNVLDTLNELQSEIDALDPANVDAITQALQVPSVDTFSSAPFQIEVADIAPPTGKGQFVAHSGSFIVLNNNDDSVGSTIGIDNDDGSLQINSFEGSNNVNVICSQFLVNGAPVGGNQALDECFDTPVSGTFSTPKPINISSINPNAAKLQMVTGGILSMVSPDSAQFTNLYVDNSAVLNITGTIGEATVDGNIGVKAGKQLKLYTGDGDNLSIQNTGSLGANICSIDSERVDISGNAYIKSGNNLYLNNGTDSASAYMNCVNNGVSNTSDLIVNTSAFIVNAGIQATNGSLISKGTNSSQQILTTNTTQPKLVFGYNNNSTYVEMELLGSTTGQLQFYNSSGNGFNFLNGKVVNDGNQLQPVNSGNTGSRPAGVSIGYMYFDTSISPKPIPVFYTGTGATNWVDANGNDA